MIVKVLGAGCPSCKRLEQNARAAVKALGLEGKVEVVKEEDVGRIMESGAKITPALVIDGKLVSQGKVLDVPAIKGLLANRIS